MSSHTLEDQLSSKMMALETSGKIMYVEGVGYLSLWGTSAPTSTDEPAKGAIFQNTSNGLVYRNDGTSSSPSWVSLSGVS